MQKWMQNVMDTKTAEEWQEWLDEHTDTIKTWGADDTLVAVFNERKEQGDIGVDWYAEYSGTEPDQNFVGGLVLAYNLQADYVNLTIPLWQNETREAVADKRTIEALEALSDLIDAKAATLRPYITAAEAAI